MVAKLVVDGSELVVRLKRLEKFGAWGRDVRVPLASINSVEVVSYDVVDREVDFGFQGNNAPFRRSMTLKTRAKTRDGQAVVVEYLNQPAVLVRLAPNTTPYRLISVSSRHAEELAQTIRLSVGL